MMNELRHSVVSTNLLICQSYQEASLVSSHDPNLSVSPNPQGSSLAVGKWGEEIVARWLECQGWEILHRRWFCRWGELDLVARSPSVLAFVEVKTRGGGNWDADGLLSITPRKRAKLWQAAELFLSTNPELANLPCRFDVAIVSYGLLPRSQPQADSSAIPISIALGQPMVLANRCWTLQAYLESAFEG
jgi:putative endonuclease